MKIEELKAKTYIRLLKMGFLVKLNHRVNLKTKYKGYKQVNIDIAVMDWDNKLAYCFYLGSIKARKMTKYKMLKLPIGIIKEESNIDSRINGFIHWASSHLY